MNQENSLREDIQIVAISGSLRQGSFNTMALKLCQDIAPLGMEIQLINISELPLYNGDLEINSYPVEVEKLRQQIGEADGLLIATPEYNYSVPGVLKNAIDWVSRPPRGIPLVKKPVGIIGASPGVLGTARAQYHLRQILVCLNAYVMNRPEIFIGNADKKFDSAGNLMDAETKEKLVAFLESFAQWISNFKKK